MTESRHEDYLAGPTAGTPAPPAGQSVSASGPGAAERSTEGHWPVPDSGASGAGASPLPSVSLPAGGGAIRSIGEKFSTNPATGTATLQIPIPTSKSRSGYSPALALTYDSGHGNGPFGFGWALALPAITRKTDKGLPRYRDREQSDTFVLSGMEDLVPVLRSDGSRYEDDTTVPGTVIHRYRPRIEGHFARVERWTSTANGHTHWRSITRDNVTTVYGRDASSQILDPSSTVAGARPKVFSWLICESFDDRGNASIYEYVAEDDRGVEVGRPSEQHRQRGANRYLKRIKYGNRVSSLVQPDLTTAEWLFEVVLDYDEEHVAPIAADPALPLTEQHRFVRVANDPGHAWSTRPDPFSSHRPGFEVRTYRRCRKFLLFHHVPDVLQGAAGYDGAVRSVDLEYDDLDLTAMPPTEDELAHEGSTRFGSFVRKVSMSSYKKDSARPVVVSGVARYSTYLTKTLPPLEFRYTQPTISEQVHDLDPTSSQNLPIGIDGSTYQLIDLDGEGVAGVLVTAANGWYYKPNLGDGAFGPIRPVDPQPAAASSIRSRLLDLAGDGQLDLVDFDGPMPGFYERTLDGGWDSFQAFRTVPQVDWTQPNLRFVDLSGDGHADVLISHQRTFNWFPSLGEEGFDAPLGVLQSGDEEAGPRMVFGDGTQSFYLADMDGDGLTDLVRVRNGEVAYWPNQGYGRFAAKVTLDNAPLFDSVDQFEQHRLRLVDVDGSGTTDVVYLGRDQVRLFLNQSGNRLSDPRPLDHFPHIDNVSSVLAGDLLGNGTGCLIWSTPLPGESRRPLRYVDLMGGVKPHLLLTSSNNLGGQTTISYAPSTRFYLEDKRSGRPWITRLPFPVHVVDRVVTEDQVSGSQFTSRYAYHHGYFDGTEREFRGFGMVEQWDTEEFAALNANGQLATGTNIDESSHVPPIHTKTWFHTGVVADRSRVSNYFAGTLDAIDLGEYYREPGLTDAQATSLLLDDTVLPVGLSPEEEREAVRALKGTMLRQETYGLDGSPRARYPYLVTEQNSSVSRLQPRSGNKHAVFFSHVRESIRYHYERHVSEPRVDHALTLEMDDFGNVVRAAAVGYGRRTPDPALSPAEQSVQATTHITYTENELTNSVDDANNHRPPVLCDARTYELTGMPHSGLGHFDHNALSAAGQTATTISFDQVPGSGVVKRLIAHTRTYFRLDDLSTPAPLGTLESRAIPYERLTLAMTDGLVSAAYGSKVNNSLLSDVGRYVHSEGDQQWWVPAGKVFFSPDPDATAAEELTHARDHFFLPQRFRDPFHSPTASTENFVEYDDHDLLVRQSRDALDNATTVLNHDYRVLQPAVIADPNGNRSAVAFDVTGFAVGAATMGKETPAPIEGDSLIGFAPDLTDAEVDDFFADPRGPAGAAMLGRASSRVVYRPARDLHTAALASASVTATIGREIHDSDLGPGEDGPRHVHIAYLDGFGRGIQTKGQVRAGPAPMRDALGAVILGADGQPVMTNVDVNPRWVASGWTVINNKGLPVRQFEPFFSDTHRLELDVRVGVSPILFYDPEGRKIGALHPDHSWEKVVFDPWRQEVWDTNDTSTLDPDGDADLADYFARIPASDYLPSWSDLRLDPAHAAEAAQTWPDPAIRAAERVAAEKTATHAGTTTVSHADALGRPFLIVAKNSVKYSDSPAASPPVETTQSLLFVLDVLGNHREVYDAFGRLCQRYDYNLVGSRIHEASMDSGEHWSLADVSGKPLGTWDSRLYAHRFAYDVLRRPTAGYVRQGSGPEVMAASTVYGESQPNAAANNLRARVVEVRDQAGITSTDRYDFKGNVVRTERQLSVAYSSMLDWSQPVPMQAETFASASRFDAMSRAVQMVVPHSDTQGSGWYVVQPRYDEGALLRQLDIWLERQTAPTDTLAPGSADLHAVVDVQYDAKGRRLLVDHGNGVRTSASYNPLTQRLSSSLTRRPPGQFPNDCPPPGPATWPGCQLQNLTYIYDPAGNVMSIIDDAQQAVFFRNRRVTADSEFTYDAIYRVVEATGRELLGVGGGPVAHAYNDGPRMGQPAPGDGNAVGRYIERYEYDLGGNITQMRHRGTDPAHAGWTRNYVYQEPSQLAPGQHGNRLTSCPVGGVVEVFSVASGGYDPHGNMLQMPQLQAIEWDDRDLMRMSRRQAVASTDADGVAHAGERTWYVYDAAGSRVRKVTESSPGSVVRERVYLGGLEVHHSYGAQTLTRETLNVVDTDQRVALVETRVQGAEPHVPRQLVRYQVRSQLGSVTAELDEQARVITYEEYTPYGSTSFQSVRNSNEAPRRYRFTGTERDEESGLYHNGARSYAPWLGRWTSPDPMGARDGTSLYAYCSGNPVSRADTGGKQDSSTTAVGITIDSSGVSFSSFVAPSPDSHVTAFGLGRSGYMETAERNTGLTAINIQDRINLGRGLGLHYPSSFQLERDYTTSARPGGLFPMFSGVMTQEALEGGASSTVHFDMRNVQLTPPLQPGSSPGFAAEDFHSSSEARQAIAHLASTEPGERKVSVVIQHEDGVSVIQPGSNRVQGDPLPSRLADRAPNLENAPTRVTGTSGGSSGGPSQSGSPGGADTGGRAQGGGGSGSSRSITGPSVGSATLGTIGRVVPGVVEGEAVLGSLAYAAAGHAATAPLVAPLLTAAEALPVVAGVGVVGAAAGHLARAAASEAGASQDTANGIGFGAAVLTGAALGSVIPGVGTAVGAGIGAVVAGGLYLWSIW